VVNVVSGEAGAGAAKLIYRQAALAMRAASFLKKRYSGQRGPQAMPNNLH